MSRQNSRDISNINVTMRGSEIGINRTPNDNLPFSDVKVLLKKGEAGNGIQSIVKTGTSGNIDTYTITYDDGNTTTFTVTNGLYALFECTCSTAASTAEKAVTLADATYTPQVGDLFQVYFENGNSAISPKLNINNKGAKSIVYGGSSGGYGGFYPSETKNVLLRYDGLSYHLIAADIIRKAYSANRTEHSLTMRDAGENIILFDGSNNKTWNKNCEVVAIPSTGWSGTVDSDGYYTNEVILGDSYNTFNPVHVSPSGSTRDTLPTVAQGAAYNLVDLFWMPSESTSEIHLTAKAKTKPTETFYIQVSGDYYG